MREEAPAVPGRLCLGSEDATLSSPHWAGLTDGSDSSELLSLSPSLVVLSAPVSCPASPSDTLGLVHPNPFAKPPLRSPSPSLRTVKAFDLPFRFAALGRGSSRGSRTVCLLFASLRAMYLDARQTVLVGERARLAHDLPLFALDDWLGMQLLSNRGPYVEVDSAH